MSHYSVPLGIEPSLDHLLVSNTPPEDEELDVLQDLLKEPKAEMDELALQMLELDKLMKDLEARRKKLQDRVKPLQALVSPIRRLPADILQEIFVLCLPEGHYPTLDPLQAPLVLTHICQRWRYVANDTRRLWTAIHIPLPILRIPSSHRGPGQPVHTAEDEKYKLKAKFTSVVDSFVGTVNAWVGRIGGCGLSFSVFQADYQTPEEDACLHAIFSILLRCSKQWEHVDVAAPLRSVGRLVAIQPEDVPSMRSLTLWSTSRHSLPRPTPASSSGGFPFVLGGQPSTPPEFALPLWRESKIFGAPQLESLRLLCLDEPLSLMPIDWSKLTSLVIEKQGTLAHLGFLPNDIVIDVPVLANVLRRCTRLERARVALTPGASEPLNNHEALSTPIHLPNLTSFAFFEDRSPSASFFRILEAPCLRKLEFHTLRKPGPDSGHNNTSSPLIPFLRRHGQKIDEFVVDTQYMVPSARAACWELLPGLKKLCLSPSTFSSVRYPGDEQGLLPFTNCDLQQLGMVREGQGTLSAGRQMVLPQLKSLECRTLSTLSDSGLLKFVKAREGLGLQRVCVAYEKDWEDPVDNLEGEIHGMRQSVELVLEKRCRPRFVQPRLGLPMRD
ncbi:hypothetical protein EST38_g153 [Candolleomyces aberdarensis]|uniref:Uncharacterized protein n=1 Tax=Candolleomyces aberdarensis TaxID=2316362 RepID=A0A4Q2E086_9AGAR|nr:hypothetical protein EST38_g153 [Candolleomyces aberdarensis]